MTIFDPISLFKIAVIFAEFENKQISRGISVKYLHSGIITDILVSFPNSPILPLTNNPAGSPVRPWRLVDAHTQEKGETSLDDNAHA